MNLTANNPDFIYYLHSGSDDWIQIFLEPAHKENLLIKKGKK